MKKGWVITTIIFFVLVFNAYALQISDDFECNGFGCGSGWTGGWATSGDCEITTLSNPIDAYHFRGQSGCDATRYFDASHSSTINVSFYATATSLENGDYCRYYYYDGATNHELLSLTNGDDDGTHDYYEFDVSSYGVAEDSGIRVYGGLAGADYCYIDDVLITIDDQPIVIDYVAEVGRVEFTDKIVNQTKMSVGATEYEPFDATKVFLQLTEGEQPVNDATCYIDIFYPDGSFYINNQAMIHLNVSNGLYFFPGIAPNVTGVYMLTVECYYTYGHRFVYAETDLEFPIYNATLGTMVGSGIYLNSFTDGLYVKHVAADFVNKTFYFIDPSLHLINGTNRQDAINEYESSTDIVDGFSDLNLSTNYTTRLGTLLAGDDFLFGYTFNELVLDSELTEINRNDNGTIYGSPEIANTSAFYGFAFDGLTDYVKVPDSTNTDLDFAEKSFCVVVGAYNITPEYLTTDVIKVYEDSFTSSQNTFLEVDTMETEIVNEDFITKPYLISWTITASDSSNAVVNLSIKLNGTNVAQIDRAVNDQKGNIVVQTIQYLPQGTYTVVPQVAISTGTVELEEMVLQIMELHNGEKAYPTENDYEATQTTSSTVIEDIPGSSFNVTLNYPSKIVILQTLQAKSSNPNKDGFFGVSINGTDQSTVTRGFGSSNTWGAVSSFYMTDTYPAGTYEIKGRWLTDGGNTLTGSRIVMDAIAVTDEIGNTIASSYAYINNASTTSTTLTDVGDSEVNITLPTEGNIVVMFSTQTNVDQNDLSIWMTANVNGADLEIMERGHSAQNVWGSFGYITRTDEPLSAGTYNVKIRWKVEDYTAELEDLHMIVLGTMTSAPRTETAQSTILDKKWNGRGYELYYNESDLQCSFTGNTTATATALNLSSEFNHPVCCVHNGTHTQLWVDGAKSDEQAGGEGSIGNNIDLTIGANQNESQKYNGLIDELGFWDKALTQSEIEWYNATQSFVNESLGMAISVNNTHPLYGNHDHYLKFNIRGDGKEVFRAYSMINETHINETNYIDFVSYDNRTEVYVESFVPKSYKQPFRVFNILTNEEVFYDGWLDEVKSFGDSTFDYNVSSLGFTPTAGDVYYMGESFNVARLFIYAWNWTSSEWILLPNTLVYSGTSGEDVPSGVQDFFTNPLPSMNDTISPEGIIRLRLYSQGDVHYNLFHNWLTLRMTVPSGQQIQEIRGGGELHITAHKTEIKGLLNFIIDYLQNTIYPFLQQIWGKLLGIESQLNTTIEMLNTTIDITNNTLIITTEINTTTHDIKNDTETIIGDIDALNQSMWEGFAEKDAHIQDAYDNMTDQINTFQSETNNNFNQTWNLLDQLNQSQAQNQLDLINILLQIGTNVNQTYNDMLNINQSIVNNMNNINNSLSLEIEGVQNDTSYIITLVNDLNMTNNQQYLNLQSYLANLTAQVDNNFNLTQQNITDLRGLLLAINLSISTDLDLLNTSLYDVRDEILTEINTNYLAILAINQTMVQLINDVNLSIHTRIDLMETNMEQQFNLTYWWLELLDLNINGTRADLTILLGNLSLQLNETKWQLHGHLDLINESMQNRFDLVDADHVTIIDLINNVSQEINFTPVLDSINDLSIQVDNNFNITQNNITDIRVDINDLETTVTNNFISLNQSITDAENNILTNLALINNSLYNEIIYTQTMLSLINTSITNQVTSLGDTIQSNFTTVFNELTTIQNEIDISQEQMVNLSLQLNETKWQLHAHLDALNVSIQNRFDISETNQETIIDLIGNLSFDLEANFTDISNLINSLSVQVDNNFNITQQNVTDLTDLIISVNSTTYNNYLDLNSTLWVIEGNIRSDLAFINNTLYNEIIYTQTLLGLVNQSLSTQMTSYFNTLQSNFTSVFSWFNTLQGEHDYTQEQLVNLSIQLNETKWQLHAHLDALNASLWNKMDGVETKTDYAIDLILNLSAQVSNNTEILNFLDSMNTNITNNFGDIQNNFTDVFNDIDSVSVQIDQNFNITQQNITDINLFLDNINQSCFDNFVSINQSISDLDDSTYSYYVSLNQSITEVTETINIINATVHETNTWVWWLVQWHNITTEDLNLAVQAPSLCLHETNWLAKAHVTDRYGSTLSPNDNMECNMTTDLWGADVPMAFDWGEGMYRYIHQCDPDYTTFSWSVSCDYTT